MVLILERISLTERYVNVFLKKFRLCITFWKNKDASPKIQPWGLNIFNYKGVTL